MLRGAFGAGLAPARAVTNGFVGWKLLLECLPTTAALQLRSYSAVFGMILVSTHKKPETASHKTRNNQTLLSNAST
mgnify:CR=1 FL=1